VRVAQVAELCSIVNRAYCFQLGDDSIPEWFGAPASYQESEIAGVQFVLAGLRKGVHIAAWDVHAAWMRYKLDQGWAYGTVKDTEAKTHPSLKPFGQLSENEQRKDYLFVATVEACYRAGTIE
jgi:hypothetical protein